MFTIKNIFFEYYIVGCLYHHYCHSSFHSFSLHLWNPVNLGKPFDGKLIDWILSRFFSFTLFDYG